nr:DUF4241 domain-containing protein [Kibdelosporangium sp. MJ126-NF4]CEL16452.1 hypothetical Cytosolic Protein [Kibdelosporangium sp. MJ126-NF4]CTQ90404.1 hypothetical Cytosolic Protein [Kibdelosporangium sp. MJ126-NF4]
MAGEKIDFIYCEGWDPVARAVAGPLRAAEASERDRSGEQYAVLLFSDGKPQALIEVSWLHHVCLIWGFDEHLRRLIKRDFRRVDGGRLVLVEEVEWQYADQGQGEFDPAASRKISRTHYPDSGITVTTDHGERTMEVSAEALGVSAPEFGDWRALLFTGDVTPDAKAADNAASDDPLGMLARMFGDGDVWRLKPLLPQHMAGLRLVHSGQPPPDVAVVPFREPLWRPPVPMRPDPQVVSLNEPERSMVVGGERVVIKPHTIGRLRMPTGRIVACAPDDYFAADREPYTVTVSPGEYDFVVNVARGTEGIGMDPRVAAAGVLIRDEPVESWELALLPSEDPRLLRDGEAFCFDVDGGMACFADAAAIPRIAGFFPVDENPLSATVIPDAATAEFDDEVSGANLLAFASGWGDGCYPVWIGRTAGGAAGAFVADMRLFAE